MAGFCPNCGTEHPAAAAFCRQCGAAQPAAAGGDRHLSAPKPPIRNWLWLTAIGIAVLVVLGAAYFLFASGRLGEDGPTPPADALAQASGTQFDVRAHCAANPNDLGPGEQDIDALPPEVRAANANYWRCSGGVVMVCNGGASGRACLQQTEVDADYVAELERYCQSAPDTYVPYSIAGSGREWRCQGPVVVPDGNVTVDAYGFLVGAWLSLDQATAAAQQAQAAPPPEQELQLTTIEGPQTGLSCWYAFDQNGENIFGSWDYEDSESTYFGVNGQRLRFTETITDNTAVFDSPEGYQITARQGAQIRDETYYEYAAGLWHNSITIRRGNAEITYQAYQFCGDG